MRVSTSNVARLQQAIPLVATALERNNARHHTLCMDRYCREIEKELKLDRILAEANPLDCVYVYWVVGGKTIKPAIIKNHGTYSNFLYDLRDEYGAFEYKIMVRRGRTMIWSGLHRFAEPLNFIPEKDIRAEIMRLRNEEIRRSQT